MTFYENPKYVSDRLSGLYVEARLNLLRWQQISVDEIPGLGRLQGTKFLVTRKIKERI